jgi:beta-glucosidase
LEFPLQGLDQESGVQLDVVIWSGEGFTGPLQAAHHEIALETARQGIVLLKNDGVLPLQIGGPGVMGVGCNLFLLPRSPLEELRAMLPGAQIEFDPGMTAGEAALMAARCDVAIVFAVRVETEGFDAADLSLPWGQDAVIEAVADANPNTIVVLETGNPVAMPWRERVRGILQAWYPGQACGRAIAKILTGTVNPSGWLPRICPADLAQTPRPDLDGRGTPWGPPTTIHYHEGAEVGRRWFAPTDRERLYAFGHGLSYTRFAYDELVGGGGATITASFTVTNTGTRRGADVPQLDLTSAAGEQRTRLLGSERVELEPGASRRATLTADARLLARFDAHAGQWHISAGSYHVALGRSVSTPVLTADTQLAQRRFGR